MMGCQGGSARTAAAGGRHRQVPAQTHMLHWLNALFNFFCVCVLSKVDTDCSMKSLTSAKIQMLIGLLCLLIYNGKKFTIPNPYFELEKKHTVMKLLLFLSGLKQHEH